MTGGRLMSVLIMFGNIHIMSGFIIGGRLMSVLIMCGNFSQQLYLDA